MPRTCRGTGHNRQCIPSIVLALPSQLAPKSANKGWLYITSNKRKEAIYENDNINLPLIYRQVRVTASGQLYFSYSETKSETI